MKRAFGVYPHAENGQPTGCGYVVRPGTLADYPTEHGAMVRAHRFTPNDHKNYGALRPVKVYEHEHFAERYAMRMTGGRA